MNDTINLIIVVLIVGGLFVGIMIEWIKGRAA